MAIMPHPPINYLHFLVLKGLLTLISCDFLVCGRTHALAHSLSLNLHHGLDWQNVDNMKFTIAWCAKVCLYACVHARVSVHAQVCLWAWLRLCEPVSLQVPSRTLHVDATATALFSL